MVLAERSALARKLSETQSSIAVIIGDIKNASPQNGAEASLQKTVIIDLSLARRKMLQITAPHTLFIRPPSPAPLSPPQLIPQAPLKQTIPEKDDSDEIVIIARNDKSPQVEFPVELDLDEISEGRAINIFQLYLNEIGQYPLLTKEEEQDLGLKIFAGRIAMRNVGRMLSSLPPRQKDKAQSLLDGGRVKFLSETLTNEIKNKTDRIRKKEEEGKKPNQGDVVFLEEVDLNDKELDRFLRYVQTIEDPQERDATISEFFQKMEVLISKSIEAHNIMIVHNLRLVVKGTKRYRGIRSQRPEELNSSGTMGVFTATAQYNYRVGFKLSTYELNWIWQSIGRDLANNSRTIRLPVHAQAAISKLKLEQEALMQKTGRTVTLSEVIDTKDLSDEEKATLLNAVNNSNLISLSTPLRDDGKDEIIDIIPDTADEFEEVSKKIITESIDGILKEIAEESESAEKQMQVLRLRFGIDDGRERTLEEIGEIFGVTRERIRQIEARGLGKLRKHPKAKELKSLLSS